MNLRTTVICFLAGTSLTGIAFAQSIDECHAERYKSCSAFRTSRAIEEHAPVIDNHVAGFTRSKGSWKITVGYGPPETCAKVSVMLGLGPLDIPRKYERVFHSGGGVISDSGSFMHKMGEVESGLKILTSHCRVPDPETRRADAESREAQQSDEERERLAMEEERERLELEAERERLAAQDERERLEEELRLAQEQQARAEERERQRLAQEQRRRDQERERRRLAQQRREAERQKPEKSYRQVMDELLSTLSTYETAIRKAHRREQERREQQSRDNTAAVMGFLSGLAGGASEMNRSGNPGMAVLQGLADGLEASSRMNLAGLSGDGGAVSGSCEQAQRRIEQKLASQNPNVSRMGMCDGARYYVRMLQDVRQELASGGCPAHAISTYDRTIAQARQTARASCN